MRIIPKLFKGVNPSNTDQLSPHKHAKISRTNYCASLLRLGRKYNQKQIAKNVDLGFFRVGRLEEYVVYRLSSLQGFLMQFLSLYIASSMVCHLKYSTL